MIPVDMLYIPTWYRISFIQSMDGQLKKTCNYCVYKNIHSIHEEQQKGNCDLESHDLAIFWSR